MRTTHTYKPKYSHTTSLSYEQKKKDSRGKGIREMLDAEEREWNAEEAVGEWGSMSANVMRTLESGVTQPERGRREIGLQGKFSLGEPGERSRQGENHGGHQVVQPKRMMVQRAAQPLTGDSVTYGDSMRASRSKKENKTGLPDRLKAGIENLSGYSMDDVRVHYNSEKPAQLQAKAYAQGTEIHLGSGQERHLPHEAWHVVQQKQGRVRPTWGRNEKEQVNSEKKLEEEAEVMGEMATTQGEESSNDLENRNPRQKRKKEGMTSGLGWGREREMKETKVVQMVQVNDQSLEGLNIGRSKHVPGKKEAIKIDNKDYFYHLHANKFSNYDKDLTEFTMTLWLADKDPEEVKARGGQILYDHVRADDKYHMTFYEGDNFQWSGYRFTEARDVQRDEVIKWIELGMRAEGLQIIEWIKVGYR
ncbi:hypothetical protein BJP34_14670 [Moorena producens PAL-8-15-08-1]|uniref:eCIS core domain-containing protein n=1 Tax=Moorena producens PAL-8-15-08-1 TaxID=1458985 RepID=A0A1D8TSC9_9CYAN|nr:DUF4157 domain-containing protein [Moorena producens]AOX00527.1 hypothetical protein BJP34_14670 [Moorena producens PAL-8-15-08-1]